MIHPKSRWTAMLIIPQAFVAKGLTCCAPMGGCYKASPRFVASGRAEWSKIGRVKRFPFFESNFLPPSRGRLTQSSAIVSLLMLAAAEVVGPFRMSPVRNPRGMLSKKREGATAIHSHLISCSPPSSSESLFPRLRSRRAISHTLSPSSSPPSCPLSPLASRR